MQDGRNTRDAPKGVWNIYFPAFCLSSTSNHSQQNRLFAFSRSLNQYPLPSSSHAKLGPSVASVMMMAARPSKALKAISLTLERDRLALGILEHWSGFEISNEEQEGALPVILLSVMHLVFCISISVPHNNFIVARNKNMYIYIYIVHRGNPWGWAMTCCLLCKRKRKKVLFKHLISSFMSKRNVLVEFWLWSKWLACGLPPNRLDV